MEILITLGVLGLLAFIVIGIYNRLVALRQNCENAFADIDVQLKQRRDLIPNLVNTVQGYAGHEEKVLQSVTEARAAAMAGGSLEKQMAAEAQVSRALFDLKAVAEAYPDLKADENFQKLQDELSDIENKIAAARRFFNNATAEFNTAVEVFPAVLFAASFGFHKREFFELPEDSRAEYDKPPEVSFS
ncbi:MAG: LemA family protein [Alphaproteobacteria bacterium]|nr:LemA family protein [Alphaproteobacteria bacterium SS10]